MPHDTLIIVLVVLAIGIVMQGLILPPLCIWMGWRLARGFNPAPPIARTVSNSAKSLGLVRTKEDGEQAMAPETRMNA